jgi:hypothetical protein
MKQLKKPTKEMIEERKKRNKREFLLSVVMALFVLFMMLISFVGGYYIGTGVTVKYFMDAMVIVLKSTDTKITANLSMNETKLVDYMFEKLGRGDNYSNSYQPTNSSFVSKPVLPCNPDPSIPRGETSNCIGEQEIKK